MKFFTTSLCIENRAGRTLVFLQCKRNLESLQFFCKARYGDLQKELSTAKDLENFIEFVQVFWRIWKMFSTIADKEIDIR